MYQEILKQIIIKIIKEQELIIGPLAWEEAKKVDGLRIIGENEIVISGNHEEVINKLISKYEKIFGKASHETCKDAVADLISVLPIDAIPVSLK